MTSTLSRALANYPNRFDPAALSELPERQQELIRRRDRVLGPGYTLIYREPVEFVSGRGAHLFDRDGNDYLDAYNNVPCVGHAHPHVVEAVARQIAAVNTNTRYLQESLVDYAERLLATFPSELSKLSLACSGSEANDLAIRVARHHTGAEGIIVTRLVPTTASRGGRQLLAPPGRGFAAWTERPPDRPPRPPTGATRHQPG